MRIVAIEKLADCFDGSSVYLYHFDQPWTQPAIMRLAALGTLDYFADFPRPFYRLRGAGGLQAKGVKGERHCRVVVHPGRRERFIRELEELLSAIKPIELPA
jgi:hypothetical protein